MVFSGSLLAQRRMTWLQSALASWLKRGLACLTMSFGLFWILDWWFPLPLPDQHDRRFAQVVTDRHGDPLRVFPDHNGIWRYPIPLDQVSPFYLQALISYEDRYFYQHPGVNPFAMLRAFGQWLYFGKPVSGGSTLTMQVARILDPHSKSLWGKSHQLFRALQLEWHLDKAQILELYLNYAPFGGPLEGVQAASFAYLGKSAADLSRAEAAMLAVLPQSPSRFRPDRFPERAETARNKVLQRLADFNIWTVEEITEARQEPVIAHYNTMPQIAPLLARRLRAEYPNRQIIQSSLEGGLQQALETLVADYMASFPAKTSAAVLLMDTQSELVLAYVGSADFADNQRFGHVDMIQANRSPGSTLKPFLYGMALDQGIIHSQSLLLDVPSDFSGYRPDNFGQGFSGPVSMTEALQRSLNVPAVQVLEQLTSESFYARLASAGLKLSLPDAAKPNLSLILGGAGTSLESLTQSFAALERGGATANLRYVTDQPHGISRQLLSPQAAWVISDALREVSLNKSLEHNSMALSMPHIAFKTGTSYGYRDAWVLAASKDVTVGVWIGRPDGSPLSENYGRRTAVPLLNRVLRLLPRNKLQPAPAPSGLSQESICWPLGTLTRLQEPEGCLKQKHAWLIELQAPPTLKDPLIKPTSSTIQTVSLDALGRQVSPHCSGTIVKTTPIVVWPASLEPWLPLKWRREQRLPEYAPGCQPYASDQWLEIKGIKPGSEIYSKPGSAELPTLTVALSGAQGYAQWYLNGEWLGKTEVNSHQKRLQLAHFGKQHLSVMDESGQFKSIEFVVGH